MNLQLKLDRKPLHRSIADELTERIISREYEPESYLPPEREMCEALGVSRTVVREAIKLLESRGLVRIERGRGTVVQGSQHGPLRDSLRILLRRNYQRIEQLLEVRSILEVGVAGLAAERRTPESLETMRGLIRLMKEKPGEPAGYVDADVQFHNEIARAAGNPLFEALLEPLSELLRESRLATFAGPRMVALRTRQHEEVMEAISAKDPEAARQAMRKHINDTKKDLGKHHYHLPEPTPAETVVVNHRRKD
jgi:DNA-binding FadR family transcriptional regulator